jgi:hypothetical protein
LDLGQFTGLDRFIFLSSSGKSVYYLQHIKVETSMRIWIYLANALDGKKDDLFIKKSAFFNWDGNIALSSALAAIKASLIASVLTR